MDKTLIHYQKGSLGIPPSCENCTCANCPLNVLPSESFVQEHVRFIAFEPGETIFFQLQPVNSAFILCRGIVERAHRTIEGKTQLLKFIGPGDWMIEELLSGQSEYWTFARVATPALVAFLTKANFVELIETFPVLRAQLLERVCQEIGDLWKRLTYRSYASPQEQLALSLDLLSQRFSSGYVRTAGVDLPLSEAKLADLTGLCIRSVARYLKRLEDNNLISYKRGRLQIFDYKNLKAMLES